MKILFTKKLNEKQVSEKLGSDFSCDFVDVIQTNHKNVKPFDLENYSLIFTSVNGVESFFRNGFKPDENFVDKHFNKIYCVGNKTKAQLRKYGFGVFKLKKNAKELSEFIIENCAKERFLHFCGNLALDILQRKLPLQNIGYQKVIVYETELLYPNIEKEYDAVAFFSPSGVRSFVQHNLLNFNKIFSIGETTSSEIGKFTNKNIFTGNDNDLVALLNLIKVEAQ